MKNGTVCVEILIAAILVCLTSSANGGAQISKYEYNILDYGATRDGNALNTAAINKAIKTCGESGGGTVIIPPGKYLSGPIELMSNVTLHLESGATIKGSSKLEDYAVEQGRASGESGRDETPQLPGLEILLNGNMEEFIPKMMGQHYVLSCGDNTALLRDC